MTLLGYSHSNLRIALTNGVNKVNVPQPRTNYFKNSFSYSHGGAVFTFVKQFAFRTKERRVPQSIQTTDLRDYLSHYFKYGVHGKQLLFYDIV